MNSNSKLIKRAFSFIMALALVLSMVLVPGVFSVNVAAVEGEEESVTSAVIYVNGVGAEDADGSQEKPYGTLAEAYADIPENNVKTYIVICGNVVVTSNYAGTTRSEGVTWSGLNWWIAPHAGEVVLTSKYGEDADYTKTASFQLDRNWLLLGNTTLENIRIKHGEASVIYANHYDLHLGENVKYPTSGYAPYQVVAEIVYLGSSQAIYNLDNDIVHNNIVPQDVTFTMESGAIREFNGTGNGSQGNSELNAIKPNVTINITGGSITTFDAGNSQWQQIGNVNINIGGEAAVGKLVRTYPNQTKGEFTCALDLNGRDVAMEVGADVEISLIDSKVKQIDGVVTGGTFTNNGAGAVSGKPIKDAKTGMYFLAEETDGVYRAYPFNMAISGLGINTMAKNPDDENAVEPAACLRASFMAFDALMDNIDNYGIMINGEKVTAKDNYEFDKNIIEAYADLNGSFRDEKINETKTVQAYMTVNGVDCVSTAIEIKPADIVRGISEKVDNLSDYHKELIAALMEKISA